MQPIVVPIQGLYIMMYPFVQFCITLTSFEQSHHRLLPFVAHCTQSPFKIDYSPLQPTVHSPDSRSTTPLCSPLYIVPIQDRLLPFVAHCTYSPFKIDYSPLQLTVHSPDSRTICYNSRSNRIDSSSHLHYNEVFKLNLKIAIQLWYLLLTHSEGV